MNKYLLVAFALMDVAFYEMSGGADFEPGNTSLVVFAEPKPVMPSRDAQPASVTRANATGLSDIAPSRAVIEPIPDNSAAGGDLVADVPRVASVDPVVDPVQEPEVVAVEQETPTEAETLPDLRFVDGDRVNMRGGPGTDYAVIGRLVRNDMVEVLQDDGNGWLHLRATASGDEGWMAARLVTAAD
jgi:hypothetical protein